MWFVYVFLYLIFAVLYNQFYKVVLKSTKGDGALTAVIQFIGGNGAISFHIF